MFFGVESYEVDEFTVQSFRKNHDRWKKTHE